MENETYYLYLIEKRFSCVSKEEHKIIRRNKEAIFVTTNTDFLILYQKSIDLNKALKI